MIAQYLYFDDDGSNEHITCSHLTSCRIKIRGLHSLTITCEFVTITTTSTHQQSLCTYHMEVED